MADVLAQMDKVFVIINLFLENNFFQVLSILLIILAITVGAWVVAHVSK